MIRWIAVLAFALTPIAPAWSLPAGSPVPSPEQVMQLPDDLRERFRAQVMDAPGTVSQKLDRLSNFIFQEEDLGLGMQYDYQATLSVREAYETRKANCLTFTLMVVALAREAGMEAYGQEIEETLAWRQEANTIFLTNHVNAGVRTAYQPYTLDVAWDMVMSRMPPKRITDQHLLSLYYNNRGAELMASQQYEQAGAYIQKSLQLDPRYASNWSNAGVLHLRLGEMDAAGDAFARALALKPTHTAALFNMLGYQQRRGDAAQASIYQRRLEMARKRDPFHQFMLAMDYEQRGELDQAVEHYRWATRLYAKEHRFYSNLARVYLQQGKVNKASRALARARSLVEGSERNQYQAKLDRLRQQDDDR